ncbi:MAG: hypothetical protein RR740_00385 [Pseudomonas sp.]
MTSPFSTAKMDPSITQEKCWEHLDFVSELLAEPGVLQTQAQMDPTVGPEIKRLTNQLLHHAVDNVSFDEAETASDAFLTAFSPQVVELVNLYQKYMITQVSELSMLLQYLPANELFSAMSTENVDPKALAELGISPEEVAALEAKMKEMKDSGSKMVAAMKPCDRLMPIIEAGICAAGGQAQFGEIQMRIMNTMPANLAGSSTTQATIATLIAAVVTAIAGRAQSLPVISVTVQGAIEAIVAAKRVLSLPFVASYNMPGSDIFHLLMTMGVDRVSSLDSPEAKAEREKQQAAVEQVFNREAKPTSTVFDGNGTKN